MITTAAMVPPLLSSSSELFLSADGDVVEDDTFGADPNVLWFVLPAPPLVPLAAELGVEPTSECWFGTQANPCQHQSPFVEHHT